MDRKLINASIYVSDNVLSALSDIARNTEEITEEPFNLQELLTACLDQGVCYYLQTHNPELFKGIQCASEID